MHFELNQDQLMFRDSVEKYLRQNYDFEYRSEVVESPAAFSVDTWEQAAQLGWLALPFPEARGGLGGGAVELMVIFEQFGRFLTLEPYLETLVLGGGILARLSAAGSHDKEIEALMYGQWHCTLAHQEADSPFSLVHVATRANRSGGGYVLSGKKTAIYNASSADEIIVTAMIDNGDLSLFKLPPNANGVRLANFETVDGRIASDIEFENVGVGEDQLLASGTEAEAVLRATIDTALVCVAAEKVGMMQAVLEATLKYTSDRKQFGVPLSSFQVLQHRMADMYIAVEMATSLLYAAAIKVRDGAEDASRFASAAKLKSDSCAREVCFSGFQLHGGIATTDECSIGHYLKRSTVLDSFCGGRAFQLKRFKTME